MPVLRLAPGRVPAKDMTEAEWARFLREAIADYFRAGQTKYDTGIGFWIGSIDGVPKLSIGDASGHKVTWDGSVLTIVGDVTVEDGSITAAKINVSQLSAISADLGAITAGTVVLPSGGFIRSGQTAYDTGTGFYLGNDSGTPKFSIGNAGGQKATWNGSALAITGAITATSGSFTGGVTIGTGGTFSSGQSAYNTGTGFWFEYNAGTPRFSIGNPAGSSMRWDGTTLTITDAEGADKTIDNLFFKGDSNTHPSIGQLLGSTVTTASNSIAGDDWQQLRSFTTDFAGSFRLMVEAKRVDTVGVPTVDGKWRLKNGAGSVIHTESFSSTSFAQTFSVEASIAAAGEIWTLEGVSNTDLSTYVADTSLRDIEVRARFNHATIT